MLTFALIPRCPAKDSWPRLVSTCTVGVSVMKSWKRRPLIGRFLDRLLVHGRGPDGGAGFHDRRGAGDDHLLRQAGDLQRRVDRDGRPTVDRTVCLNVAKPGSSTVTSYVPGGSSGSANTPCSLVTTERTRPVWVFRAVTVTPGRTAPCASRTRPLISPVVACDWLRASAGTASVSAVTSIAHNALLTCFIPFSLLRSWGLAVPT